MESTRKYQHFAAVGISVLAVGVSMAMVQYKIPTIMTSIMSLFSLSAFEGSWLMSIFTLMAALSALAFGALSQKFSPRLIIAAAAAIILAGSLIGAWATSGGMLIASRAIEGIALTAVTTCGPIIIQQCVRPDKIGSAMGIWGTWGPLGSVIAGLATPVLYATLGFTGLWLAYAAVCIVATVAMLAIVHKPPRDENALPAEQPAKPRFSTYLSKNTILFFLGFAAFNLCLLAVLSYVPVILQQQGMDATLSGFVSTLPMLLSLVSSPFFGALSDKTGKTKQLLVFTMAFLGPCAFVLYTQQGWALWGSAIIMGVIGMGSTGLMLTAFTKVLPGPEYLSFGMGMLITVQGIGQFLGTFLVQALLGADFSGCFIAGIIIMLLGIAGTACLSRCKLKG